MEKNNKYDRDFTKSKRKPKKQKIQQKNVNNIVFPSYKQTRKQIIHSYEKKYIDKINKLNNHISSMKTKFNEAQQHRALLQQILKSQKTAKHLTSKQGQTDFSQEQKGQQFHQFLLEEINKEEKNVKLLKHQSRNNVSSLNEMIQDDCQQMQNNLNRFESHLKFRKKALQRQLFEEDNSCIKSHENQKENQNIYINLFQENLKKNYVKLEKQPKNREILIKKSIDKEKQLILQNRQKLRGFYRPFLDDLKQTNIVKWRILNN